MKRQVSRRNFIAGSVGFAALGSPIAAAAQSVGVKASDLPDLTIKEVKVYVTNLGNYHSLNGETGELFSVVTHGGIEGNYTPGNRNPTVGWLQWAKSRLVGKSVIDLLPTLTSTSGLRGTYGFNGELYGTHGLGVQLQGGSTFHRSACGRVRLRLRYSRNRGRPYYPRRRTVAQLVHCSGRCMSVGYPGRSRESAHL